MNSARKQVARKVNSPPKTKTEEKGAKVEEAVVKKEIPESKGKKTRVEKKTTKSPVNKKQPTRSLSVSTPKISQQPKAKKSTRTVSKNILKEIKYYQNNIGFLIPRASIVRIIRRTLSTALVKAKLESQDGYKFSSAGFDIMHESLENYLVCLMELSYMAAKHAKRVTLFPSDIRLISRIRNVK
jgi:histone H3